MTNVIVNAIDVLGQEVDEGVVRISAADAQYVGGSLMLPEYHDQGLVAGSTTFFGVTPGKVIVTIHWGINRTATFRVVVPDTDEITLAALTLQQYDTDPAIVSQVTEAALHAVRAAGGVVVAYSEEEAAALPVGTIYVMAGRPATPVTIVGTVGDNVTTDTFTPFIPNANTRDTIIIAANTKAVSGSTVTAPAGFTTLVDGYWKGTQRSWVFAGPWSGDLTVTADQPLEFGYAAVAVRGAASVTTGMVKDREMEPTESTTVTAPAVEHGTNDLAIGIAFERTSAAETPEQVTVNEGWTIEHYTGQGTNFQTTLIGTGGTGDMVVTYPNAQATNGVGVQVVARA